MSNENEIKRERRVDEKRPETELSWVEPRFNSIGIAETWSVTVEAEGQRVLCISDQHYAGLAGSDFDPFVETVRSCGKHLLAFVGAVDAAGDAAAPTVQAPVQTAVLDSEKAREAFESWYTAADNNLRAIERIAGGYKLAQTNSAWEAWLASKVDSWLDTPITNAPVQTAAEVRDFEPEECWSRNQEDFNDHSLSELIEGNDDLAPGMTVWVGEAVRPDTKRLVDADDVLDQMGDRAYDVAGEHADGYPDVTKDEKAELDALLAAWVDRVCPPKFYEVKNVRPYVLTAGDFTAQQLMSSVAEMGQQVAQSEKGGDDA